MIVADVEQDVTAAGRSVSISGRVGGDVIAAGETVIVNGEVADDVRAAGRIVMVSGRVGDHMVAAGQRVSVEPGAEVGGRAWLSGGTVSIEGRINRDLKAAARKVKLSGQVGGDVDILAEEIEIEAGAVVQGDLVWRGETQPEISAEAHINGQVIQKPLPEHVPEQQDFPGGVLFSLGLVVGGVATYLLLPRASVSMALAAQASPWKSLGLGLTVFLVAPMAVGLLLATVVGYLLALMLLALYLFMLALGALAGLFSLGDLGLRLLGKRDDASKGLRVLSIVTAVVMLAVMQMVPVLGGLIGFLVWLVGLGAVQLSLYRACTRAAVE
jgi:cytoskeletal protein CcmA (bactofilin family)